MSKIYSESEVRAAYAALTKFLIRNHISITTMESATSGQIASLITDTEGASAIFKGADITYCNEAKIAAGVPAEVIMKYSVYSKETALAMAKACRSRFKADVGIGVTGTMGNIDPENAADSQVGVLYFAIATEEKTESFKVDIPPQPSRLAYKLAAAGEICEKLMVILDA